VEIFLWSRALVWLGALFALAWFEPHPPPLRARWDSPFLHDLGSVFDVWARWDAQWFVRIAEQGYDTASESAAFFPLYPTLVAGVGRTFGGHYVLAGIVVSLACCLGAFVLLERLAEERLGTDGARRALLYLALFPTALFLQAVYSESLFLLLALATFVLAERGRFGWAAAAAGLAMLTRASGVALLPPLALLAWPDRRRLGSLLVAPALFAVYPVVLWLWVDDPWAFLRSQGLWHRHFVPFGGVWEALVHWTPPGADTQHAVLVNLEGLVALLLFAALAVVAWRRFGAPYGLYAAGSLALPLSFPSERWPLLSLPRFGLAIFPLFLALAWLGGRPRVHAFILGASAFLLGITVVQWVLWQWVA
jgi:Ca2+/Na+ antiporter